MGPLRMAWSTEKGRLVCHWVECARQQELLSMANVPGSVVLAPRSAGLRLGLGSWQMPTSGADQIPALRH